MSVQVDVMLALLGAAVATGTFVIGRLSAARTSGAEWGCLKADIGHIKSNMEEMKEDVRHLDERLDEHIIRHAHG